MPGEELTALPANVSLLARPERQWWELMAPEPLQCEVRTLSARCSEVAEYVLSFRGKDGHVCVRCLPSQIVGLTRFGPVTIEKLP